MPETDQPVLGDVDVELEPVTDIIEVGTDSEIIASVTATEYDLSEIEVTWKSSLDGTLGQSAPDTSGRARMSTAVLSPGWHDLTVEVRNPAGRYDEDTEAVGICEWAAAHDFDTNISGSGWQIFGDAYWDPGGWLEMTGNSQSRQGAIFLTDERINPGAADIRFKIATGGG